MKKLKKRCLNTKTLLENALFSKQEYPHKYPSIRTLIENYKGNFQFTCPRIPPIPINNNSLKKLGSTKLFSNYFADINAIPTRSTVEAVQPLMIILFGSVTQAPLDRTTTWTFLSLYAMASIGARQPSL